MIKELLIGSGLAMLPVIIPLILSRAKTQKIGEKLSKILRNKLGRKLENRIELTLLDILAGMRKDNTAASSDMESLSKAIESEKAFPRL